MGKSLFVFVKHKSLHVKAGLLFLALLLLVPSLLLLWTSQGTAAGQITSRSLTISSAVPSATGVSYTFGDGTTGFKFATSHIVKGMKFQACTTAVGGTGGCTAPAGLSFASAAGATLTNWQDNTAFSFQTTNVGDCDGTQANVICIDRAAASVAENTSGFHKILFTGIVNPSTANSSFYVRMTTYTTSTFTVPSITDAGTVAAAVVQSLQVSANVAEILQFCIGNTTTVFDATTADTVSPGTDCSAITGTTVNIGTLDPSTVNISPVSVNGGNNSMGIAMLRSNAINGATISYRAIQAGTGSNHLGTLRLSGATCSAASGLGTGSGGTPPAASGPYTDSCIDAAGVTQNAFTAGIEQFGMTVAGVDCASATSYACTYSAGTNNLQQQTNYIGGANTTTFGASAAKGFAWDESGTTQTIASSAGSTIKQVDDEALILAFGATPSITTPFGSYTVQADFIAVPTY